MASILVTGSAGFIGFHLSQRLLKEGHRVVGFDNLNNYYDPKLKRARNKILSKTGSYTFVKGDLADPKAVNSVFKKYTFDSVFHLAAQTGVRYSLEDPHAYLSSNIDGTLNILEAIRHSKNRPQALLASSGSVYGTSKQYPFSETETADRPATLYGATKRSDELIAHSYAHLFDIKVTLLRFFSVYGPWGRPDMALFLFTDAILKGKKLELYNGGDMIRDFTYVDDIVEGILSLHRTRGHRDQPNYDVFNIGCGDPRPLTEFLSLIEKSLGKKAKIKELPFQAGDIYKTVADVSKLKKLTGYAPQTRVEEGVPRFVKWYREYYGV